MPKPMGVLQMDLVDRVAIVTGSARNIGRSIALTLARAGASVVVTTLKSAEAAEATAQEIRASGGRAIVKLADVREPAQASGLVAAAVEAFGRLDILVNNAAVRHETDLATVTYEEYRAVVSVILDGAFLMAQAAMPYLVRSDCGSIVNIGGMTAHLGAPNRVPLLTAKIGLIGMTRGLAHDLAPHGVTVNCVVPGLMTTIRGDSATAGLHSGGKAPPIGRRGTPDDIASLVHYLCSPQARYVTGQTIHANGGGLMP
jgi:3-oxoacyl-[acyl-carrier protein] reductase